MFLEEKDGQLSTIKKLGRERVTLQTNSGQQVVSNPLEQARQYAYATVDMLKRDPQLVHAQGQYQGRLCFPYGSGVVLANITRQQWESGVPDLEQERLLPADRLSWKEES